MFLLEILFILAVISVIVWLFGVEGAAIASFWAGLFMFCVMSVVIYNLGRYLTALLGG